MSQGGYSHKHKQVPVQTWWVFHNLQKYWMRKSQMLLSGKWTSSCSCPREVLIYALSRTPWSGGSAHALMCSPGSQGNNSVSCSFHISAAGHHYYLNGLNQAMWKGRWWEHMGLSYTLKLLEEVVSPFAKALIAITRCTQTPNDSLNILQWERVSPQQSLKKTFIL